MVLNCLLLAGLAVVANSNQARAQTTTSASAAGSCPTVLTSSNYDAPVVGSGYTAQLVVTGLTKPRGLIFDKSGALLVVESGVGITRIQFNDRGGTCLVQDKSSALVRDDSLNHGIELSSDSQTLYASSSSEVYSWPYDPTAQTLGTKQTLITNMSNTDHTTRTLLLSKKFPDQLLVSRGSSENIDDDAASITSGHSQIRVFNISSATSPYTYATDGRMLGWGLRNSVGVAEHPQTGGLYSVENSADQLVREGTDIHQDNPGEEMNFHGYLNGSTESQGGNYGYPHCFALWDTNLPDKGDMKVGSQFVLDPSATLNDTTCAEEFVAPRLTFQAHMAPLDIKFTADGSLAYVSFHGSWNRDEPVGYKLSVVSFANGEPVEAADSTEAAVDILSNADNTKCPGSCFRPAGLAIDAQGRVFMSSDATGEIYVLQRAEMTATGGGGGGGGGSSTSGGGTLVTSTATTSTTPNAAARQAPGKGLGWLVVTLTLSLSVVGGAFLVVA
ncbi:soluble quino protein glucose dehydrogenase [Coniochaeta ligniaria NRRL 30616]|uniref:Soluble quino protein glucose dehydrogenase n=1 Tax=Coniochaeta ligniaria NRRL 30616 TaxID=1408157 RepID=A0A1J7IC71_9PEZI|nr:soluble quino protein glucose dehydrogenase [Coniochaeta ligniaria NRRL 30616]